MRFGNAEGDDGHYRQAGGPRPAHPRCCPLCPGGQSPARPGWLVPPADADRKTIRYSPDFIGTLAPEEVHFVIIGREPGHVHLLHHCRGRLPECDECRQKAADLEDNEMCQAAGFKLLSSALLPGVDEFGDCNPGETFEQHYARLHAKHKQGGGQQQQPGQPGDSQGNSDPGGCGAFEPCQDEAQA